MLNDWVALRLRIGFEVPNGCSRCSAGPVVAMTRTLALAVRLAPPGSGQPSAHATGLAPRAVVRPPHRRAPGGRRPSTARPLLAFDRARRVMTSMAENLDAASPQQRRELVALLVERVVARDR